MSKILAFAGSGRKQSYNKKLVAVAARGAESAGAEVTIVDLADFPAPIFCQDLESAEGMPQTVKEFKRLLIEHDGFLIASPEYNSSYSPLLKNMIDWASRKESDDEPPLLAYKGKYAAIMAASPGVLGGLRGLMFLRLLLSNIGVTVLAEQQAIAQAAQAFAADGSLVEEKQQRAVIGLGRQLAETLGCQKG